MVLLAYGGRLNSGVPEAEARREYDSSEMFDIAKLKNHRGYYFGLSIENGERTLHIFDKGTFREVTRT